jgi:hypothetical protein
MDQWKKHAKTGESQQDLGPPARVIVKRRLSYPIRGGLGDKPEETKEHASLCRGIMEVQLSTDQEAKEDDQKQNVGT